MIRSKIFMEQIKNHSTMVPTLRCRSNLSKHDTFQAAYMKKLKVYVVFEINSTLTILYPEETPKHHLPIY